MKAIEINGIEYRNPLIVFAMKEEAGVLFNNFPRLFTGIGKINATYELTKALATNTPDIVINLGTAGSTLFNKGKVVCCHQFVQRDMEVTALGFEKFVTPFSHEKAILDFGIGLENFPLGICGTGDSFETEHNNPEYNVIDMEAYALALVCKKENIPFLCLKYISDGADGAAVEDWNIGVKKAAQALLDAISLSNCG